MIKITYRGLDEITDYIRRLPRGVKIAAMRAFVTYIIGDSSHGLRHEPPYSYVSRASVYGETFSTLKQQRWFWANGGPEMIGNNRTHAISNGWTMRESNSDWTRVTITNSADGVDWVMGDKQAAQPAAVGWRNWGEVAKSNVRGGLRAARAAVNALLNSRGRLQ